MPGRFNPQQTLLRVTIGVTGGPSRWNIAHSQAFGREARHLINTRGVLG